MQLFKTLLTSSLLALLLSCSNVQTKAIAHSHYFDQKHLPNESRVPGGVALVNFDYQGQPGARFNEQPVMLLNTAKHQWTAVVGLALTLKTGSHTLHIGGDKGNKELTFEIHHKEYQAQYLTLQNEEQVSPGKAALERIGQEASIMRTAFRQWSAEAPMNLKLNYPVEGPLSGVFGSRRFFNNQPRNPHSGLDIAAPRGSLIGNPLPGRVIAKGDYFFNGNTVLIDHGQGMISMYCHMDEIKVSEGQQLNQGDIIGTVGSTGRATGPHLHWTISLNNTRVDPMLFLKEK